MLAPNGTLEVHEKAWNAFPYCRTLYSNPYMKDGFYMLIETIYAAADTGTIENIHDLTGSDLEKRTVVNIDIANDPMVSEDYKPEWDPTKVKSEKANRGPLPENDPTWKNNVTPVMCCYKVVKVYFKWWGLQNKVEKTIIRAEERLFRNFHRQAVCWLDNYYGMTMDDIREIEDKTYEELNDLRTTGEIKGTTVK